MGHLRDKIESPSLHLQAADVINQRKDARLHIRLRRIRRNIEAPFLYLRSVDCAPDGHVSRAVRPQDLGAIYDVIHVLDGEYPVAPLGRVVRSGTLILGTA